MKGYILFTTCIGAVAIAIGVTFALLDITPLVDVHEHSVTRYNIPSTGDNSSNNIYSAIQCNDLEQFSATNRDSLKISNGQLVRHNDMRGTTEVNYTDASINAPHKFVISPVDIWSDGGIATNLENPTSTNTMSWYNASGYINEPEAKFSNNFAEGVGACYNYRGVGGADTLGTWRLPNHYELQTIWTLHDDLMEVPDTGFTALGRNRYWSATEKDATRSWFLIVDFNYEGDTPKSTACHVRCVRDLALDIKAIISHLH